MIYPEMLAAKEIVNAIRRPWTRQYWELFGGALILIGVKVRENSRLVNKQLAELLNEQKLYHIVAIKGNMKRLSPRYRPCPARRYRFLYDDQRTYQRRADACRQKTPEVKKIFIMGRQPHRYPHQPVSAE